MVHEKYLELQPRSLRDQVIGRTFKKQLFRMMDQRQTRHWLKEGSVVLKKLFLVSNYGKFDRIRARNLVQ